MTSEKTIACLMRAIGYVRVSTEEQATDGCSLAAQIEKLRAYAALYQIELVDILVERGASAKTLDRPELQKALERLDRGEADGILIPKLDRLSRSVGDWDYLIKNYFGEKAGFQLWSVADAIDTRTAAGRMVLNILMSVAQWERETTSERTRDTLKSKKNRGEKTGGLIPFGYELGADQVGAGGRAVKTLQPCAAEQEILALIRELRAGGMKLQAIAAELERRGIARRGVVKWEHTFLSRLLKRDERAA
jgi:DNA invertase Pin-like site-specific DNA recombinase